MWFLICEFYWSGLGQNFSKPKAGPQHKKVWETLLYRNFCFCVVMWFTCCWASYRTAWHGVGWRISPCPPPSTPSHLSGQHISTSLQFKETPTGFFILFICGVSVIRIRLSKYFISTRPIQTVKIHGTVIFGSAGKADWGQKSEFWENTTVCLKNNVRCSVIALFYLYVPTGT
jgi:hypothetical protein